MNIELVAIVLAAILSSSVLTGLVNGFFNRRRTNTEINKINAEIEESRRKNSIEEEKRIDEKISRLVDDQRAEIDALNGHILQLQKESREAKAREKHLESEIDKLKEHVETYRDQANRRKEENRALKEQIEVLKNTFRGLS
jgi:septal ring factor EnvC (AmiA/AmiB activator)